MAKKNNKINQDREIVHFHLSSKGENPRLLELIIMQTNIKNLYDYSISLN